jgi:hypothetical protein
MKRKGLSLRRRKTLCQKLPEDFTDNVINFLRHVIRMREEHSYLLSQIGNADQTLLFFYMPRNTSVEKQGLLSVTIKTTGAEKQRCTIMLAATADGDKLTPYLIFKRKTLPKEKFPPGIHVRVQEKGWMDQDLVKDWVDKVWDRRPGALRRQQAMLVLDSFRDHLNEDVKKKLQRGRTDMVVIPGGVTSILQPLDKPFKESLRRFYGELMAEGNHRYARWKNKAATLETMCSWILRVWDCILSDVIVKMLKKAGISNALDGTEDDVIWQEVD